MKLRDLVFQQAGTPDGPFALEVSQIFASRQGQRWKVIRAAKDHNDICVFDPDAIVNSKTLTSQFELACWLADKVQI